MKNNLNKAFSLAEIIVSMALIVLLSVVGFMACNVSLTMQDNRDQHYRSWSFAYSAVDCLRNAVNLRDTSVADNNLSAVMDDFNNRLAFLFGTVNFTDEFNAQYGADADWEFFVDCDDVYDFPPAHGLENALTVYHSVEQSGGNPLHFVYSFTTSKYQMDIVVTVNSDSTFSISINAKTYSNYRLVSVSEVL